MILDIRGTNGSGKSFIPHSLIKAFGSGNAFGSNVPCTEINTPTPIICIGRYKTQCGGADGVTSQAAICATIENICTGNHHLKTFHVLVEGCIVASVYTRWQQLAAWATRKRIDYDFLFLDTPLELCINRVRLRRRQAGNDEPFEPSKTLIPRHHAIQRVKDKLVTAGSNVYDLNHRSPVEQVMSHLGMANAWSE